MGRSRLGDLLSGLLDAKYNEIAGAVLNALGRELESGILDRRFIEFIQRAEALQAEGNSLDAGDMALSALLADMGDVLGRVRRIVEGVAPDLQMSGVEAAPAVQIALGFPGLKREEVLAFGWNEPDPLAVAEAVGLVRDDLFEDAMGGLVDGVIEQVRSKAIAGIVAGRGPVAIATDIQALVKSLPLHRINTLMRTVQLVSFRRATAIQQRENARLIEKVIRLATLDKRTCLACIVLHGSEIPIGAPVIDHHAGRCVSATIIKGRERAIMTGAMWMKGLSTEYVDDMATFRNNPSKLEAIRRGEVQLEDFIEPYADELFGMMLREGSLQSALERKRSSR